MKGWYSLVASFRQATRTHWPDLYSKLSGFLNTSCVTPGNGDDNHNDAVEEEEEEEMMMLMRIVMNNRKKEKKNDVFYSVIIYTIALH